MLDLQLDHGGPGLIIAIIAITYFNSEAYLGKQFYEVYSSPFLTKEGRQAIQRNSHTIAILPDEFDKNPKRIKERKKKHKAQERSLSDKESLALVRSKTAG